ncbi:MAG: radical SAM protein [Bacteroidia bacterium]|nr:radical SAM protein [Bacteroidia bacterium]
MNSSNNNYYLNQDVKLQYIPPLFCSDDPYYQNKRFFLKYYNWFLKKENQNFEELNESMIIDSFTNSPGIVFELTQNCNLCCTYCESNKHFFQNKKKSESTMDSALAFSFLEKYKKKYYIKRRNSEFYISFYGGEPLLEWDLLREIVSYSKKIFSKNTQFHITTNGLLLENKIEYLVDNNFIIRISIDGNKIQNANRIFPDKGESFEVLSNILEIIKIKFPLFFNDNISFQSVITKYNSNIDELNAYFKRKYDKETYPLQLSLTNLKEEYIDKFENDLQQEVLFDLNVEKRRYELNKDSFWERNPSLRYFYNRYFIDESINEKFYSPYYNSGTCIPFSRKIFINANGSIFPCEKSNLLKPLGSCSINSLNINFNSILNSFSSDIQNFEKGCEKCSKVMFCNSCIYLSNNCIRKDEITTSFLNTIESII